MDSFGLILILIGDFVIWWWICGGVCFCGWVGGRVEFFLEGFLVRENRVNYRGELLVVIGD